MARASDGRLGVSVNADTVAVLDAVIKLMQKDMGITVSYTQAIQFIAHEYIRNVINSDNVTEV